MEFHANINIGNYEILNECVTNIAKDYVHKIVQLIDESAHNVQVKKVEVKRDKLSTIEEKYKQAFNDAKLDKNIIKYYSKELNMKDKVHSLNELALVDPMEKDTKTTCELAIDSLIDKELTTWKENDERPVYIVKCIEKKL